MAEMRPYKPTVQERLRNNVQTLLERIGYDRYYSRGVAERLIGGGGVDGSNVGIGDFVPGLGDAFALQQAGRDIQSGDVGSGAIVGAASLVGLGNEARGAIKGGKKLARRAASNLTQIPVLRGKTVDEATAIARKEPHLIPSGDRSEGAFLGGPRAVQSKRKLTNIRNDFDAYVAQDPRGADWYDRYRAGVREVTGANPKDNLWMSNQEGQWSAGVGPDSELQFALRENNASLMGMPVKSARPAQHQAHLRAIDANDPAKYQLGDKTGEYAGLVNPNRPGPAGATGVNDFRHARNFKYTEPDGSPQRGGLTEAQHTFLDYETALAVDRANKKALGGRTDWTGERLQAAPWVRQKALDILGQRPNLIEQYVKQGKSQEEALALAYEDAFKIANKSITEHFPKHTMNATYEAQPGSATGHLSGSMGASQAERGAFAADPRSTWGTAPGGRDAIYSGLRLGDTGVASRVRPTTKMQGFYYNDLGQLENNPGEVARPLVSFVNTDDGKKIGPADRAMVEAAETLRAAIDAQDAGAAHINFIGQAPGVSNSVSIPRGRKESVEGLLSINEIGKKYGLPDVSDTGKGVTLTRFYPEPDKMDTKKARGLLSELDAAGYTGATRSQVDSVYADLKDQWKQGEGSGAVTRKVLELINVTPEARAAFDNNPYIAKKALGNILRDKGMEKKWGVTRKDLENFRKIIAKGPGWVGRTEEALKSGGVALPAVAGAVLLEAYRQQGAGGESPGA
ncbi:MAG: hypothetical protein ACO3C4_01830 [Candidatus Limnocylindrus sp.]